MEEKRLKTHNHLKNQKRRNPANTQKQRVKPDKMEKPIPLEIIASVLLVIVIIKLMLNFLPSYKIDMGVYRWWAAFLNQVKFNEFYTPDNHCVYGPGYMYVLWFTGKLYSIFSMGESAQEFLVKLWPSLSDVLGGILIYLIGKKYAKPRLGFILGVVYMLNPGVFFNSSAWGQFDSVLATMLLGVVYLFDLNKSSLAVSLYAAACVTKPQAAFLAPVVIALFIRNLPLDDLYQSIKNKFQTIPTKFFKELLIKSPMALIGGVIVYTVTTLPFNYKGQQPFLWVINLYLEKSEDYPYASANGSNIWTLLGGQLIRDTEPFWGLTYKGWGTIFLVAVSLFSVYIALSNLKKPWVIYYSSFFMLFGSFMVYTKMHERYLFPALIFLTVGILWDKKLWIPLVTLSLCRLGNEWYAYYLGNKSITDPQKYSPFIANKDNFATFIAAISFIAFIYSMIYVLYPAFKSQSQKHKGSKKARTKPC